MINDRATSERMLRDLIMVGYLTINLLQMYCRVCFERIFEIVQHLAK